MGIKGHNLWEPFKKLPTEMVKLKSGDIQVTKVRP